MKKIKKLMGMLILCLLFSIAYHGSGSQAQAKGSIESFDNLSGTAKYLGSQYRDNYYLDIQKCGLLDAGAVIMNGIANILFGAIKGIAFIVCSIFYRSMDFNIATLAIYIPIIVPCISQLVDVFRKNRECISGSRSNSFVSDGGCH